MPFAKAFTWNKLPPESKNQRIRYAGGSHVRGDASLAIAVVIYRSTDLLFA